MCEVSTISGTFCSSVGRVSPYYYEKLDSAVKEIYALEHYTPTLLSLQDCKFVRDTFQNITTNYCPPLEHYLKIITIGLGLISAGVLLCLILWILFANRPKKEEAFANIKLSLPVKCVTGSKSHESGVKAIDNRSQIPLPDSSNQVRPLELENQ